MTGLKWFRWNNETEWTVVNISYDPDFDSYYFEEIGRDDQYWIDRLSERSSWGE